MLVKCQCQHCGGLYEYEAGSKFEFCPHCQANLREAMNQPNSPRYVTCPCQHCSGKIEFDANLLDVTGTASNVLTGQTIACPHCGLDTILFVPKLTRESKSVNLADRSSANFLVRWWVAFWKGWSGRQEVPLASSVIEAKLAERKTLNPDWRNEHATEKQKEKLRFFGCTWNGDITVRHASDALLQCARDFPDREMAWQKQNSPLQESTQIHQRATTIKTAISPGTFPTTFDETFSKEITIQEAPKPDNTKPGEYTIPARDVQYYAQRHPAIQKPATNISSIPIERFTYWLDIVLKRNNTCLGGHWLPVGPVCYPFTQYIHLTIGLCRQIADTIEAKGYCVEPDARFGNGKYEKGHTLALFKPFEGDPIQPSTAYLGAANLLRLCMLITTADGQIDQVELDVFRQAIENQNGLTRTDHKRLLILEQLLAQELASASKIAAKITRSVPADERLVVGKLLVKVAAANKVITSGERRALEEIFKALRISSMMIEKFINQFCPRTNSYGVQSDVSAENRFQWNQWRANHPGFVIDDNTLVGKDWNFTDWKTLNARWQDLHERLAARQINYGTSLGASGEQISRPVAVPAPKDFALDMEKVYQITNETKEVVAILSVVMEDEPENSITLPNTVVVPAPEIPNGSSDGNAAPEMARFNGLDATFHPILERLLTRDSWPLPDFNALAGEFHFMPLKIRDTLNEWSDEALGDFILDGEDPVIIRRELMAKETTCYG